MQPPLRAETGTFPPWIRKDSNTTSFDQNCCVTNKADFHDAYLWSVRRLPAATRQELQQERMLSLKLRHNLARSANARNGYAPPSRGMSDHNSLNRPPRKSGARPATRMTGQSLAGSAAAPGSPGAVYPYAPIVNPVARSNLTAGHS